MYSREDIDAIRAATDMANLVSAYTQLRRSGTRLVGLCPFHAEKTPSFTVNEQECFFHCFGCKESGDCFTFVQKTENLDFTEAVEWLADRAGVRLTRISGTKDTSRKKMLAALKDACNWYHSLLFGADAREARSYLRERGYNSEIAKRWMLGWAPGSWSNAKMGLQGALSHPTDILLQAGLLKRTPENELRDVQQARIVFPIWDHKGEVIAFGGRALPGRDKAPKYINSPETPLYKKSRVLFGLNRAKSEIVRLRSSIITEGYTDVIGLHEMGFANTVATCGTALTRDHLEGLKRFSPNIVLAFDPDTSGQAAAERIHQWETELGLHITIADLADHGDPGEISQKFWQLEKQLEEHQHTADTEHQLAELRGLFTHTQQYLQFRVDRAAGGTEAEVNASTIDTQEERQKVALKATKVIGDHPERDIKNKYLQRISLRFDVDESRLRQELLKFEQSKSSGRGGRSHWANQTHDAGFTNYPELGDNGAAKTEAKPSREQASWQRNEERALLLLCHFPEAVPDYVDEWLFEYKKHREICRALLNYETYEDIALGESEEIYNAIAKLRVMEPPSYWPEPGDEDPESLIVYLLVSKADRRSRELDRQIQRASLESPDTSASHESQPSQAGQHSDLSQLFQEHKKLKNALEVVRSHFYSLKSAEENLVSLLIHEN